MRTKQGFTLIELILVIALLGVIIGLAIPLMKNSYGRVEAENRAASLASRIDACRQQALFEKRKFTLETARHSVVIRSTDENQTAMEMVELPDPLDIESDVPKAVIYPDGSMDVITLKIRAGNDCFVVSTASSSLKTIVMEEQVR